MDQIKIGKFIKECRNNKGMTQQQLADKLMVSFKTISKWECGKGLPEVSLMIPLCEVLEINVNELLSGCHIEEKEYMKKAEENLVNVLSEVKQNKKKILVELLVGIPAIISFVTIFIVAGTFEMEVYARVILLMIGVIAIISSIIGLCFMEHDIGYYECLHCHEKFVPSMKAFVIGPHTITRRRLKCPKCGKVSYCKKRLSK